MARWRPVFGRQAGLSDADVAFMVSAVIFAGAIMQFPAGRLSDRMDRRYVLAGLSMVAAIAGLLIFVIEPAHVVALVTACAIYGATANALYPIAASHANDFAAPEDFREGVGRVAAALRHRHHHRPDHWRPDHDRHGSLQLFMITACAHVLIAAYAMIRSRNARAHPRRSPRQLRRHQCRPDEHARKPEDVAPRRKCAGEPTPPAETVQASAPVPTAVPAAAGADEKPEPPRHRLNLLPIRVRLTLLGMKTAVRTHRAAPAPRQAKSSPLSREEKKMNFQRLRR